ncbi:MAG: hypothetical protein R2824_26290 [Saprospiraceae bacterium]|nr:hypothetical protein [Lewinella sp.]
MPLPTERKGRIFAWVLLLILCLQRVLGLVSSELVYTVEVISGMSDIETTIAQKLQQETGTEVQIKIRDRNEVENLQILGYSAPFVFSEDVDGTIWYYTVENKPSDVIRYTYNEAGSNAPANLPDTNRFSKEDVLTKFFWWTPRLPSHSLVAADVSGQTVPQFRDDPFIAVRYPPPRSV